MLVKIMPKGRCGLAYILGETRKGHDERQPRILAGNVKQAKDLLRASRFENKFTSIALSYEREITLQEAVRDIASFEAMLLPGLAPGLDYERVWVRHREYPKDAQRRADTTQTPRTALHCVIVNTHLATGKRLQPYWDRVDRELINSWQEITNVENGYESPHDPKNKRAVRLGKLTVPPKVADLKATLNQTVIEFIKAEQIADEDDLMAFLRGQGFTIKRRTKKSISLTHSSLNKPLRLEGGLYEHGGIEQVARTSWSGKTDPRAAHRVDVAGQRKELERRTLAKRDEIARKYARRRENKSLGVGKPVEKGAREIAASDRQGQDGGRTAPKAHMDPDHTGGSLVHLGSVRDSGREPVVGTEQGDRPGPGRSPAEGSRETGRAADSVRANATRASGQPTADPAGAGLASTLAGPGEAGYTGDVRRESVRRDQVAAARNTDMDLGQRLRSGISDTGEIIYGTPRTTHALGRGILLSIGRIASKIGAALERVGTALGLLERIGRKAESARGRLEQADAEQAGEDIDQDWVSMSAYGFRARLGRSRNREQGMPGPHAHRGRSILDRYSKARSIPATSHQPSGALRDQNFEVRSRGVNQPEVEVPNESPKKTQRQGPTPPMPGLF